MATKFYARGVPGLYYQAQAWSPGYKSSAIPASGSVTTSNPEIGFGRLVEGPAEALTGMYVGIGNTSTSHNGSTWFNKYVGTFMSDPLAAQTIGAGTWTAGLGGISESSNAANNFFVCSVYVWRPSTDTVVGYIWDSTTPVGSEASTSLTMRTGTFSGASVVCQAGDVLVWEIWMSMRATMSGTYGYTIQVAGTDEVANGTSLNLDTNTGASWLVPPADISLTTFTETRWHLTTTAPSRGGPGETFHSTTYPRSGWTLYDTSYTTGSMSTTAGGGQVSRTFNAPADNTYDVHVYSWVSPTLEAVTVPTTVWNFMIPKVGDDNRFFGPFMNTMVMYVWRPSTGSRVATIMDTSTPTEFPVADHEWANLDYAGTFSSRSLMTFCYVVPGFSVEQADQIVVELWSPDGYLASSTNHPYFYLNGTTDRQEWGVGKEYAGTGYTTGAAILQIPHVSLTEYTGGLPYSKTFDVDAFLTASQTLDLAADAMLVGQYTRTLAANAVLGAAPATRTFNFPQLIG